MNAPKDLPRFYQPRRPGRDVKVASLSINALYQSPTGRLCQLLPRKKEGVDAESFGFVYTDGRGPGAEDRLDRDGFRLTAANVPLLREVLR